MSDLIIRGVRITEDKHGHVSLTDLWKIAGSPSTKTPSDWRRLPTTPDYLEAVAKNMGFSHVLGNSGETSVIYVKRGRTGGTFSHIYGGIAYAEYLSSEFAVEVHRTYVRVRKGDLTLVDEILQKAEASRHHNEVRDISKQVRKRYADVLTAHRAGGPAIGFCTDAIYKVLLGGTAKQVVKDRNLPAKSNLRAELPTGELLQTLNTEYLSAERIEALDINGKKQCADASAQVATYVKGMFEEIRKPKGLQ